MPDDIPSVQPDLSANPFVTQAGEGATTLSYDRSPLVRLGMAANRYARLSSRAFQESTGLGAMDWRVLVSLVHSPDTPVAAITSTIGIDKAAISRALARLEAQGLVTAKAPGGDARRKLWRLTQDGQAMHDAMLPISLSLHDHVLTGFSTEDVASLNALLTRMIDNLDTPSNAKPQVRP